MTLEPGLYVAATPIGNLKDASFRLVETLKAADVILCEDTRQTGKLCAAYGVTTPRKPYHDHNAAAVRPAIIAALKGGGAYCLVSDAGTPLISDPGFKLVAEARAAGVDVFTIPGPSAAIAALSIAGLPSDRFMFAGFPPTKEGARRTFYENLARIDATLIFYESPSRLATSLGDMQAIFGDRPAAVARELTKLHEEVRLETLGALARRYDGAPPKGEIVIIVGPPAEAAAADEAEIDAFLASALAKMSVRDAAAAMAETFGMSKKEAYDRALAAKARP